jgi:hypothetical protein
MRVCVYQFVDSRLKFDPSALLKLWLASIINSLLVGLTELALYRSVNECDAFTATEYDPGCVYRDFTPFLNRPSK